MAEEDEDEDEGEDEIKLFGRPQIGPGCTAIF